MRNTHIYIRIVRNSVLIVMFIIINLSAIHQSLISSIYRNERSFQAAKYFYSTEIYYYNIFGRKNNVLRFSKQSCKSYVVP